MTKKRITTVMLAFVLLAVSAISSGCGRLFSGGTVIDNALGMIGENTGNTVTAPEVGRWHAEVKLSSLDDEVFPFWGRLLFSIIAGNTAFEADAEFAADGTFSFVTNTTEMKDTIAQTTGSVAGLLLGLVLNRFGMDSDVDLSVYIDRMVETILPETVMGADRDCFGTYDKAEDGTLTVTTTKGDVLYYKLFGKTLVQLDTDGTQLMEFSRVSDD